VNRLIPGFSWSSLPWRTIAWQSGLRWPYISEDFVECKSRHYHRSSRAMDWIRQPGHLTRSAW
jgi:hypothetical protein